MEAFEKYLTKKEQDRVIKRREILRLLKEDLTIRAVAKRLKVSTATVIKIKKYFTKKRIKSFRFPSKKTKQRWIWG